MNTSSYKTIFRKNEETRETKKWLLVDAENEILGRLASKVAYLLRGKHKTDFTPHIDAGDNVIIINARKVRFSGKKMNNKVYVRHTTYPGGQRFSTPKEMLFKKPEFVIEHAVRKMLPTTRLSRQIIKNLHVYADAIHPHEAQQPKTVNLKNIKEKGIYRECCESDNFVSMKNK
ncbi:MAG: 50S ribosomal protein L13 [Bacteroidota bacterium]